VLADRSLEGVDEDVASSVADQLANAGWRGEFRGVLGHSNADGYVDAAVISAVGDYGDEAGAAAAFEALTGAIAKEAVAVDPAPEIGDEAALHTDYTRVLSYSTSRSTLTFRSGQFVGRVEVLGPGDARQVDRSTVEALGQRLVERIDGATASDGVALSGLTLELDAPATNFIERYDVLDGDVLRFWDDTDSSFATRSATYKTTNRVFRQDQSIPDGDKPMNEVPRFSVSTYQFADADAASAWLADVPSRRGLEPIKGAKEFGDESLTFAETYEWSGTSRTGYRVYIRVGPIVAAPTIDGPGSPDISVLEALAEAQTECLVNGSCDGPAPVPQELLP